MRTEQATLRARIVGIGAWGPGFCDWPSLAAILRGERQAESDVFAAPKPEVIPANERRRAPLAVKLPVESAWQALQESGLPADALPCVFSSGLGDTEVTDYLCRELLTELKQLSPTKFHNSVHNAPAGYWTISSHCMQPANSISGYQHSAGVGLLEGLTQCVVENTPVLIALYDIACTEVFRALFHNTSSLALSLIVVPEAYPIPGRDYGRLSATCEPGAAAVHPLAAGLTNSLRDNPAAAVLGLLRDIARAEPKGLSQLSIADNGHLQLQWEQG